MGRSKLDVLENRHETIKVYTFCKQLLSISIVFSLLHVKYPFATSTQSVLQCGVYIRLSFKRHKKNYVYYIFTFFMLTILQNFIIF